MGWGRCESRKQIIQGAGFGVAGHEVAGFPPWSANAGRGCRMRGTVKVAAGWRHTAVGPFSAGAAVQKPSSNPTTIAADQCGERPREWLSHQPAVSHALTRSVFGFVGSRVLRRGPWRGLQGLRGSAFHSGQCRLSVHRRGPVGGLHAQGATLAGNDRPVG